MIKSELWDPPIFAGHKPSSIFCTWLFHLTDISFYLSHKFLLIVQQLASLFEVLPCGASLSTHTEMQLHHWICCNNTQNCCLWALVVSLNWVWVPQKECVWFIFQKPNHALHTILNFLEISEMSAFLRGENVWNTVDLEDTILPITNCFSVLNKGSYIPTINF